MIPPKRARLLAAGLLVVVALAGCQQDRQPSATPAATTSTVASTTTKPPVTAAERAWPAGVAKLRRRMDRVFFESRVVLTQAKLREYIRTGRSCAPGLARLGLPTVLLRQPAATAARACGDYERAAAVYQRVAPLLGTAAVSKIGDLLEAAAEHEGNGSNGLRRAEADAKVILA
jgi:hypothetical protein